MLSAVEPWLLLFKVTLVGVKVHAEALGSFAQLSEMLALYRGNGCNSTV